MIRLNTVLCNDYDSRIKAAGRSLFCYSDKYLKSKYKNSDEYEIIGEVCINNQKKTLSELDIELTDGKTFCVSRPNKISRMLFKEAGYVCVGKNQYVLLLKSRLPFFITFGTGIVVLACMSVVCWNLLTTAPKGPTEIAPYNPLPQIDEAVVRIDEPVKQPVDNEQKIVRMRYTAAAVIDLSDGSIMIDMNNPNDSTQSMVLELYLASDEGNIKIAESGLIPSGYALPEMRMIENSAILSEGLYHGKFLLSYYSPSTGEKAIVDSWIDGVQVIVRE